MSLTFPGLCEKLGVSTTVATRLVAVVTHLKRADALRWGEEKASAVLDLARALGAGDRVFEADKKAIARALPAGETIESISVRDLEGVAEKLRHAHQPRGATRGRGRTTTPGERALATALQRAAHKAGFDGLKVEAKATLPGRPAQLVVRGVPADRAQKAFATLASAARG